MNPATSRLTTPTATTTDTATPLWMWKPGLSEPHGSRVG